MRQRQSREEAWRARKGWNQVGREELLGGRREERCCLWLGSPEADPEMRICLAVVDWDTSP